MCAWPIQRGCSRWKGHAMKGVMAGAKLGACNGASRGRVVWSRMRRGGGAALYRAGRDGEGWMKCQERAG